MAGEKGGEPTVEDVVRRADAAALSIEKMVADPGGVDFSSAAVRTFCEARAAALSAELKVGLGERPPSERLAIANLLELTGDPAAADILADLIEEAANGVRGEAIVALSMLQPKMTAALDGPRLFERLDPLFAATTDRRQRRNLARILVGLDAPTARAFARRLLKRDDDLRMIAARRLAKDGDAEAWPVLKSLLLSRDPAQTSERSIAQDLSEDLAKAAPALRGEIAETVAQAIDSRLDASDNRSANEIWRLLDIVAATSNAREQDLLEKVVASLAAAWVRGVALERLAQRQGAACTPRLEAALNDLELRNHALAAVKQLGGAAATPSILGQVRTLVSADLDEEALGRAVDALRALVGDDDPAIAAALQRLDPWRRFTSRCRANGARFTALIDTFERAALFAPGARDALTEEMLASNAAAWDDGDEFGAVLGLLYGLGAAHAFDVKHYVVPPKYDELLAELAGVAAPRVALSAWSLRPEARRIEDDAGQERVRHEIQCLLDGAPAQFEVADYGRYFDVAGLLAGLNGALSAAGRPERFATLYSGDQGVYVVVTTKDGMALLRAELDFPFSEDPDASMQAGAAYARHVVRMMDEE